MKDRPSFHTRHRVTREPLSEFHRTPLLLPVNGALGGEILPRLYPSPGLEARHLPHHSRDTPFREDGIVSEDPHWERQRSTVAAVSQDLSAVGSPELARIRARGRHWRDGAAKCAGRRLVPAGRDRGSLILALRKWMSPRQRRCGRRGSRCARRPG